jgi:hypothetical protein
LTLVTEEHKEGFHGDGYRIIAYSYSFLEKETIVKLKEQGFVNRNKSNLLSVSLVDNIIAYDEKQLCFVKNNSERLIEACIIDTTRKIIVAYQIYE